METKIFIKQQNAEKNYRLVSSSRKDLLSSTLVNKNFN